MLFSLLDERMSKLVCIKPLYRIAFHSERKLKYMYCSPRAQALNLRVAKNGHCTIVSHMVFSKFGVIKYGLQNT